MTKHEAIVISAYTGILMCDFGDMHEFIEKIMGRPVWTHELGSDEMHERIKEKVKPEFLRICAEVTDE